MPKKKNIDLTQTEPQKPVVTEEVESEDVEEGASLIPQTETAEKPASYVSDALRTRDEMNQLPRVNMIVPLDIGEKPGTAITVTINGYRYVVPKAKLVSLPSEVARILADHLNISISEGMEKRLDRDPAIIDALS